MDRTMSYGGLASVLGRSQLLSTYLSVIILTETLWLLNDLKCLIKVKNISNAWLQINVACLRVLEIQLTSFGSYFYGN